MTCYRAHAVLQDAAKDLSDSVKAYCHFVNNTHTVFSILLRKRFGEAVANEFLADKAKFANLAESIQSQWKSKQEQLGLEIGFEGRTIAGVVTGDYKLPTLETCQEALAYVQASMTAIRTLRQQTEIELANRFAHFMVA